MSEMTVCRLLRLVILAVCGVALSSQARGQQSDVGAESEQTVTVSEASFGNLVWRLEALERSLQEKREKTPAPRDEEWHDTSRDGWVVKWGGRAHGDFVLAPRQNATSAAAMGSEEQNYWQFRRLRLEAEGEGYGVFVWRCQLEFAPLIPQDFVNTSGALLAGRIPPFVTARDVYLGVKELPLLGQLQVGNFKAPFSLEELTSDSMTTFMERSLISTAFVPQRQLGVGAFDNSSDENATWQYGCFFDDTLQSEKMRSNDRLGAQFVGRASWTPYFDEPSSGRYLVHTALAYRYVDDWDNQLRFRSRPEINNGDRSIDSGAFNGDWYESLDAELAITYGSLSVQSELVWTRANASGGLLLPDGTPNRIPAAGTKDFYGGYGYVSYFLTGETRPYKRSRGVYDRIVPLENFWVVRGAGVGHGAWETVARWSCLNVSGTESTASGVENDLTLGLNWYWNPQMRWMFEYIHAWSSYDKPLAATGGTLGQLDMLGMRAQVDW